MKYHKIAWDNLVLVIIAEPLPGKYFWLSIYLDKSLRNKIIATELIKHLLFMFPGKHEIHWSRGLTTLNMIAKMYKWKIEPESSVFENCRYAIVSNIRTIAGFSPLLLQLLRTTNSTKCPPLINYKSRKDIQKVIATVKEQYKTS